MDIGRREFMTSAAAIVAAGLQVPGASQDRGSMYGRIGKMTAVAGQREALIAILLAGTRNMPGCLSYVVARDTADGNTIWITEVWDSQGSHAASLALPGVRDAIAKGRPLIAGFGDAVVTEPVGGHGLAR